VDAFLSPSRFSADKHADFGFPFEMQVLPHFLAPVGPPPERSAGDDGDAPFFLFVGRLEKIKGLQDVIPLFTGRDDRKGDAGGATELWIAGSGEYEPELRRLAGDGPRVRFLGSVAYDDLRALYARSLAVVAPSVCYEVFPMIALEAFREGTPVVARRRGPYPEIISQSGGGILFDDATDLGASLARLAGEPAFRAELSRRALASFEEYWSEERGLQNYYDVIRRIARQRGIPRVLEALGERPEAP
jgi:glycosyltransferase involved in cell wall biosynthesis